jgi:hypothetical protein
MLPKSRMVVSFNYKETALVYILSFCIFVLAVYSLSLYLKEQGIYQSDFENLYKKDRTSLVNTDAERTDRGFKSKGEYHCKKVCERIFGKKFDKIRPDFLKNNVTGHNLELDLFNEELGLAVEFNGRQHYAFIPFFHKNYEAFLNQKYRDELKRRMCETSGIRLIEVPYTIRLEDIDTYIRLQARVLGYDI